VNTTAVDKIACGIAGWSYPDWEGYVYPPGTRDRLAFVAPFVDMIEINSTFYSPPSPRNASSWFQRTAHLPGFFFTAKLHKDITHRGRIDPAIVRAFHAAFSPMAEAGRLRHLLAQFRYDFADNADAREHLAAIHEHFGSLAHVVLELRHNSWQSQDALAFLASQDITVANLDYPRSSTAFDLPRCTIGKDAYLRLHGRNTKAWFSKDAGRDETYNYAYTSREIEDIVLRATELASMSTSLTLVANNHYQGKELMNVLEIKAALTGKRVDVPPPLADRYPRLRRIAESRDGDRQPQLPLD
jgi:uncharacterized protein YecE (DUF72 family)